jgi:hypothetical protein
MFSIDVIVEQVAKNLVKGYNGMTALRFPKYRNGNARVSEQESKVFFLEAFTQQTQPFHFAVEVPTATLHNFQPGGGKSGKSRSGLYDMAIYSDDALDWVLELKSKQPAPKNIKKDFQKMVSAGCNCLWFHTLKKSDSKTLSALLEKINDNLKDLKKLLDEVDISKEEKEAIKSQVYCWKFAIVVLEQRKLYTYTLTVDINKKNTIDINNFKKTDITI